MSVDRIIVDETLNPQRITVVESGEVIAITIGDTVLTGAPGPQGEPGPDGPQGIQGVPGEGVPTGGVSGDVLYKDSATDYDTSWVSLVTKNNEWLATKSTTNLAEGTNLYYTNARVNTFLTDGSVSSIKFGNNTSLVWNATDATLEFPVNGEVTLQIGQENLVHVKNGTGSTLANGTVVRVTGSSGSNMTVDRADNTNDIVSADTIAVMTQSLNNNAVGFATTQGLVRGLNTSSFAEGAVLWLGSNGTFTATKPTTPLHLVQVGYVIRSHATQGSIFVHINNGWELDELHDVLITTPTNGQVLGWDSANGYWKNISVTTDLTGYATEIYADAAAAGALSDANDYTDTIAAGKVSTSDFTTLFNSNFSAKSTDNLTEGSTNLYYTASRFDSRLASKTSDNLTEGSTNLYYTASRFDSRLATKSTDNLTEGSTNLYYTNGRVDARIGNAVLNDLANVSGTPVDGQVLTYDGNTGEWTPANSAGGSDYTIPSKTTSATNAWSIGPNTLIIGAISTTSTPGTNGQIRYQPLHVTQSIVITDIRVAVASASSLNNCNIQVWIDRCNPRGTTGWQPTVNHSYLGEFTNITTTGEKIITGLSQTVEPGYYLIAFQVSPFTGTLGIHNTPGQLSTGNGYILTGVNSYAGVLWTRSNVAYTSGTPFPIGNFVPVGIGSAGKEHLVTIQYDLA